MSVDHESGWPLVPQVAQQLIARIRSGEFPPGSRLPPELDLRRALDVSRATVSEGLGVMHLRELVVRRNGVGSFIRKGAEATVTVPVPAGSQVLARLPSAAERAALGIDKYESLIVVRRPGSDTEDLYPASVTVITAGG